MRIAINAWFWDQPTTGSGQYTHCLVKHLAEIAPDLEIALLAPEGEISNLKSQISNVRHQSTANHRLPANLHKVWFEQIAFPRACRRLGVDVAHVPYWAPPLRPSVPTVATIHDLIPMLLREYRGGPSVRLYTTLVGKAAQSAALVLTDSESSRRDIIAHLGLMEDHVRAVHLAAETRYSPDPDPDDAVIRTQYNLPQRYVLYLGGFDVRKNLAAVIGAYRKAAPTIGETCPLVIAGQLPEEDMPFTPDPRRLVWEHALEERLVHFPGFVAEEDKPALYRGAVAFIFPSRYEGFGLPPLEALACGTPVVGSNVSSIPEVVGDGGLLLPPDDVEGMAKALVKLAADASFRAELSLHALAQASRFSCEKMAKETLAAYRDATGQV
ncbi:MAG: glycosyltransferase family 4 protein [Anaerolineae bacterium]|nr:glycosyltransferase family 4 protein [Anaerolineae bacterium]